MLDDVVVLESRLGKSAKRKNLPAKPLRTISDAFSQTVDKKISKVAKATNKSVTRAARVSHVIDEDDEFVTVLKTAKHNTNAKGKTTYVIDDEEDFFDEIIAIPKASKVSAVENKEKLATKHASLTTKHTDAGISSKIVVTAMGKTTTAATLATTVAVATTTSAANVTITPVAVAIPSSIASTTGTAIFTTSTAANSIFLSSPMSSSLPCPDSSLCSTSSFSTLSLDSSSGSLLSSTTLSTAKSTPLTSSPQREQLSRSYSPMEENESEDDHEKRVSSSDDDVSELTPPKSTSLSDADSSERNGNQTSWKIVEVLGGGSSVNRAAQPPASIFSQFSQQSPLPPKPSSGRKRPWWYSPSSSSPLGTQGQLSMHSFLHSLSSLSTSAITSTSPPNSSSTVSLNDVLATSSYVSSSSSSVVPPRVVNKNSVQTTTSTNTMKTDFWSNLLGTKVLKGSGKMKKGEKPKHPIVAATDNVCAALDALRKALEAAGMEEDEVEEQVFCQRLRAQVTLVDRIQNKFNLVLEQRQNIINRLNTSSSNTQLQSTSSSIVGSTTLTVTSSLTQEDLNTMPPLTPQLKAPVSTVPAPALVRVVRCHASGQLCEPPFVLEAATNLWHLAKGRPLSACLQCSFIERFECAEREVGPIQGQNTMQSSSYSQEQKLPLLSPAPSSPLITPVPLLSAQLSPSQRHFVPSSSLMNMNDEINHNNENEERVSNFSVTSAPDDIENDNSIHYCPSPTSAFASSLPRSTSPLAVYSSPSLLSSRDVFPATYSFDSSTDYNEFKFASSLFPRPSSSAFSSASLLSSVLTPPSPSSIPSSFSSSFSSVLTSLSPSPSKAVTAPAAANPTSSLSSSAISSFSPEQRSHNNDYDSHNSQTVDLSNLQFVTTSSLEVRGKGANRNEKEENEEEIDLSYVCDPAFDSDNDKSRTENNHRNGAESNGNKKTLDYVSEPEQEKKQLNNNLAYVEGEEVDELPALSPVDPSTITANVVTATELNAILLSQIGSQTSILASQVSLPSSPSSSLASILYELSPPSPPSPAAPSMSSKNVVFPSPSSASSPPLFSSSSRLVTTLFPTSSFSSSPFCSLSNSFTTPLSSNHFSSLPATLPASPPSATRLVPPLISSCSPSLPLLPAPIPFLSSPSLPDFLSASLSSSLSTSLQAQSADIANSSTSLATTAAQPASTVVATSTTATANSNIDINTVILPVAAVIISDLLPISPLPSTPPTPCSQLHPQTPPAPPFSSPQRQPGDSAGSSCTATTSSVMDLTLTQTPPKPFSTAKSLETKNVEQGATSSSIYFTSSAASSLLQSLSALPFTASPLPSSFPTVSTSAKATSLLSQIMPPAPSESNTKTKKTTVIVLDDTSQKEGKLRCARRLPMSSISTSSSSLSASTSCASPSSTLNRSQSSFLSSSSPEPGSTEWQTTTPSFRSTSMLDTPLQPGMTHATSASKTARITRGTTAPFLLDLTMLEEEDEDSQSLVQHLQTSRRVDLSSSSSSLSSSSLSSSSLSSSSLSSSSLSSSLSSSSLSSSSCTPISFLSSEVESIYDIQDNCEFFVDENVSVRAEKAVKKTKSKSASVLQPSKKHKLRPSSDHNAHVSRIDIDIDIDLCSPTKVPIRDVFLDQSLLDRLTKPATTPATALSDPKTPPKRRIIPTSPKPKQNKRAKENIDPNLAHVNSLDTPKLREMMISYGLKPKSKPAMRKRLFAIWQALSAASSASSSLTSTIISTSALPSSLSSSSMISESSANASALPAKSRAPPRQRASQNISAPVAVAPVAATPPPDPVVAHAIRNLLFQHDELYLQVILFQTLDIIRVEELVACAGIKCSSKQIRDILDANGVSFSQGANRQHSGPIVVHKKGFKRR